MSGLGTLAGRLSHSKIPRYPFTANSEPSALVSMRYQRFIGTYVF